MAFATAGRNFYVAVPLNMFMMTGYAAMQSMLMLEGSKTGMAQGTSESNKPTPLECLCDLLTKLCNSECFFGFDFRFFMCVGGYLVVVLTGIRKIAVDMKVIIKYVLQELH